MSEKDDIPSIELSVEKKNCIGTSKPEPEKYPLKNINRKNIHKIVHRYPGIHYRRILNHLGLSNGTLYYHLSILEKEGVVVSSYEGAYRRFFSKNHPQDKNKYLTGRKRNIFNFIKSNPGQSPKSIASKLLFNKATVNYHLQDLKSSELIRVVRDGRKTYCFALNLNSNNSDPYERCPTGPDHDHKHIEPIHR